MDEENNARKEQNKKVYLGIVLGAFLFAAPYNLLTTPLGLYSGNLTGAAQIIRTVLMRVFPIPANFDCTGIILYMINIPLFFLAYKELGRRFFLRTLLTVTLTALFFSILPIPSSPPIEDRLTAALLAGAVSGFGAGLILRCGSSGGGIDIIGMYCLKKNPDFGVGKITVFIAIFIFIYCGIFYELETMVYSAIFTVVSASAMDKAHYQNVKMFVMLISKSEYLGDLITCSLGRSATFWKGTGAFSMDSYYVYVSVVSRYEAERLRSDVEKLDPNAFIVIQNIQSLRGHFESHL